MSTQLNSQKKTKKTRTANQRPPPPKFEHPKKNKKTKKSVKPAYVVTIPTQQANYQSIVKVKPEWNPQAVKEMQAAMTSYFLSRSITAAPDNLQEQTDFYDGMVTQWRGFATQASGTPALDVRLRIIHDLIKAFEQKSVKKYRFHNVSYAWENISLPNDGSYATGWNVYNFVVPGPDSNDYLSPATVYLPTPSDASYSAFMGQVKAISSVRAHYLTAVSSNADSPLVADVSCYAKVYPYLGLDPSQSGGYYNDIENEVTLTAPILSHNVIYPQGKQDDRVPMKLHVNQGGPAANLAPLLAQYDSWFNKRPLNFKFLDLYEVVDTLIYWYLGAVKAAIADGAVPSAFAFSSIPLQSFVIVVRQAILSLFKDQWIGQFVGPLNYDSVATNFLPFQVLGNCYGNDTFKKLLAPSILAENLSMLQTQKYTDMNQKSKINSVTYVPVWGYYNDIQPEWKINFDNEPGSIPLFAPADQFKSINLVDCTIASNQYINVNSAYYTMVMETWNANVSELKKYINVCDLTNLSPPSNSYLMQATRVYGYIPDKQNMAVNNRLPFPCLKPISNLVGTLEKQSSKKNVLTPQLPQPTDVVKISIQDILSEIPVSKEIHELYEYMILPCVRFDPNSPSDVLNKTMYQTITGEGLSQIQNAQSTAPAYLNRLMDTGNMCVEGAGKITSSNLAVIMRKLCSEGNGGVLSALLGGFAKNLFPDAAGLIDTVSTVLPF